MFIKHTEVKASLSLNYLAGLVVLMLGGEAIFRWQCVWFRGRISSPELLCWKQPGVVRARDGTMSPQGLCGKGRLQLYSNAVACPASAGDSQLCEPNAVKPAAVKRRRYQPAGRG